MAVLIKVGAAGLLAFAILAIGQVVPASAAKRPDLVVAKLGTPPDSASPGASFKVKETTRNRGRRKARRSTTGYYLSPRARLGKRRIALGKRRVKALRPGARKAGRKKVTIPASTAARSYHLIACADARRKVRESKERNNCRASKRAIDVTSRGNATTSQLIDDAVARGEISPETGLKYKVFAAFGDSRLPTKYDGAPDVLAEAPLDDVIAKWGRLSANARKALGPFLIPPFHEGSYLEQQIHGDKGPERAPADLRAASSGSPWCVGNPDVVLRDWSYVEATHGPAAGKIRIWYQDRYASTDAKLASNLMDAMEDKIWPSLTSLMGHEPLPDGGSTDWCAGGSDAVDIALVDIGIPSTYSHTSSNENTPAQMYFPRSVPVGYSGLKPLLAHEFMHMIQYSFTFKSGDMQSAENKWLREGTAQWAMDYVTDPKYGIGLAPQQEEHEALKYFFPHPDVSLDSPGPGHHDYGSYVFPLWAVRSSSNPSLVREIWDAVGAHKSLEAAKSAFGGGWNQAWKDFARTNWNQGSIDDYRKWDGITDKPKVANAGTNPTLPNNKTTSFTVKVAPVAAKYLTFQPESGTETLTYTGSGVPSSAAGVQAIITHKDGSDSVEDWSDASKKELPACDVKEITLALSNSSIAAASNASFDFKWQAKGSSKTPKRSAQAGASGQCRDVWTGTASGTFTGEGTQQTWNATVNLEPYYRDAYSQLYELASAHVTWSYSDDGGCSRSMSYDVDRVSAIGMWIQEYEDPQVPDEARLDLRLVGPDPVNLRGCGDHSDEFDEWLYPLDGTQGDISASAPWAAGTRHLSGQETHASGWNPDYGIHWQWDLSAG